MIKVTFYNFSKITKKEYRNTEFFKSINDARLYANAMNWQIEKTEEA